MSLPFNRHEDQKAYNRAFKRVKNENNKWDGSHPRDWKQIQMRARHLKDTPHPCSCNMCGNPRRSGWTRGKGKLTLQEIKATTKDKYQDNE